VTYANVGLRDGGPVFRAPSCRIYAILWNNILLYMFVYIYIIITTVIVDSLQNKTFLSEQVIFGISYNVAWLFCLLFLHSSFFMLFGSVHNWQLHKTTAVKCFPFGVFTGLYCLFGVSCFFLDAFAKFRKATVSVVMSVRLSVCPHGTTRLPLDGFSWNLIFERVSKICRGNPSYIKTGQE